MPTEKRNTDRGADLIGAHYTTWLAPDEFEGDWTPECAQRPWMGNYEIADPEVVEQHIEWALDHGLNWFWTSWWGKDHVSDDAIKAFLEADGSINMRFSVLYESNGLLKWNDDDQVDFDDGENVERLVDHFEYFADNFFDEPNYCRLDGKPVVFFFVSGAFTGDVEGAFERAQEAAGEEAYLIGDLVEWEEPTDDDNESISLYDAITTYNSYRPREDIDEIDFVDQVMNGYDAWFDAAQEQDVDFIPEVVPGFDDTNVTHVPGRPAHPVLERDPERFAEMCDRALEYTQPGVNAAFLTSFNEWFENSVVEPSESEGTEYLEILRDHLARL